jgi:sugar/nucleoside kinase (ribokinase family)
VVSLSGGFRVTVVGPVSLDEIFSADGGVERRYGGALYALAAYARIARGGSDRVALVSHVDRVDADWLARTFGDDPHVDLSGVSARDGDGTRIELRYLDRQRRRGVQRRRMRPVEPRDVDPFLASDAFIVLPLTAEDVPLETMVHLRRNSPGLILLDAHGPLTHVAPDGERLHGEWVDADRFLPFLDVVKMNREEARLLLGDLPSAEACARAAARLLAAGPRVVWQTSADQSSIVVFRPRSGDRAYWALVPAVTGIGPVRDTTGCGDAAAAGFIFAYLRSGRPLLSAAAGNTIGSLKAVLPSTLDLPEPWQVRGLMTRRYGDFLQALVDDFLTRGDVLVHPLPLARVR